MQWHRDDAVAVGQYRLYGAAHQQTQGMGEGATTVVFERMDDLAQCRFVPARRDALCDVRGGPADWPAQCNRVPAKTTNAARARIIEWNLAGDA